LKIVRAFLDLFRNRGFVLLNLANLLDGICYFGMVPLLIPFVRQHFHLDDVQAGWVMMYYGALVTLLMFPGGMVCDRLGARKTLILALGVVASGRSLLVYSAQAGVGWALLALTMMASGTGMVQPSVYAGVKEYTHRDQGAAGYSWLYAIMNLGSVLWFLVSPQVRAGGGIDRVYLVLTLLTWFNLGLQALAFRQPPLEVTPAAPWSGLREAGAALLSLRFLVFIWLLIPVRNLVAHLNFTLPTVVERCYPWAFAHLEYAYALNNLLLFVGTPLLTYATLRVPLLSLMIGGSLLSALSLGFLMLPPSTLWLIGFVVVFSLGEAIWQSRFYEYVAHQAPHGKVGAAMSWANFPWFVAKTTVGLYSGWMLKRYVPAAGPLQPQWLWGYYLGSALLTPVLLAALHSWLTQGLESQQTEVEPA
jgi:dipeptide/tripeptide permease